MFDHFLEWLSARYQPRFRLFRDAKALYERFERSFFISTNVQMRTGESP